MAIQKVVLVGANGDLGGAVLGGLVDAGSFQVAVLKRQSSSRSNDNLPPSVQLLTVPDSWTEPDLTATLRSAGADAVVACFALREDPPRAHLALASAAAAAGVRRYIPADFGSVDSRAPRARELVPLFGKKAAVRALLDSLAESTPTFSWTSIVCGHFFDWGLRENFLHVDLKARTHEILDQGEQRSSLSTLAQVGRAVVAILNKTDETRNRTVFIQSFCVSQNDVQAALEKATGTTAGDGEGQWKKTYIPAEQFIAEKVVLRDAGDKQAIEDLVFALGVIDGDWEKKDEFAMDLLGLQPEDLEKVVKDVVDEVEKQRGQ
ncbi:hypothetical protein MCOR25_009494 [Pyricularia grisea]|nr:hypothetical protein MCOR25_009494 [Pyricularia grisea]